MEALVDWAPVHFVCLQATKEGFTVSYWNIFKQLYSKFMYIKNTVCSEDFRGLHMFRFKSIWNILKPISISKPCSQAFQFLDHLPCGCHAIKASSWLSGRRPCIQRWDRPPKRWKFAETSSLKQQGFQKIFPYNSHSKKYSHHGWWIYSCWFHWAKCDQSGACTAATSSKGARGQAGPSSRSWPW